MPPRLRRTAIGVAALILCAATVWTVRAEEKQTYNVTLSHASVSQDAATGETVVTMPVRGDLPGVLTLGVTRNDAGTITGGQWSLVVSYTATTLPSGEVVVEAPDAGEEEQEAGAGGHQGADALVQKGVIKGSIQAGTIALNADGSVRSLTDVVLAVTGGTMQYAGATGGSGLLSGSNLSDRGTSSGAASLIF